MKRASDIFEIRESLVQAPQAKTEFVRGGGGDATTMVPLLEALGEVATNLRRGSFEGIGYILYRGKEEGMYGILKYSWGYFIHNNPFYRCRDIEAIQELMDKLYSEIQWFDFADNLYDYARKQYEHYKPVDPKDCFIDFLEEVFMVLKRDGYASCAQTAQTAQKKCKKIWSCKIGEVDAAKLPEGADTSMRRGIEKVYNRLVGEYPDFIFSGWGAELDEHERAAVSDVECFGTEEVAEDVPTDTVERLQEEKHRLIKAMLVTALTGDVTFVKRTLKSFGFDSRLMGAEQLEYVADAMLADYKKRK